MANFVGDEFNNTLTGGTENDTLLGNGGADVLLGEGNDDLLDGGAGADSMSGGSGNDSYLVDDLGDMVVEAADDGFDTVTAAISYTLTDNVEVLVLDTVNVSGNINGAGNALNNIIYGNEADPTNSGGKNLLEGFAGDDTLYGYNGQDTLDGGTGADVMYGGTFGDIYIVDNVGDVVNELVGEGADTVQASISYTLVSDHLEHVTLTGSDNINATGNGGNNNLTGNAGSNLISGGAGNDVLKGHTLSATLGDDTLDGGAGNDDMAGGNGNDTYYVDSANLYDENNDLIAAGDKVTEGSDYGTDTVITTVDDYTLGTNVENLIFGAGVVSGNGNGSNNVLTGNELNNELFGDANEDTLYGGAGADTLDGGLGNDEMYGGADDDVYYVNSTGDVTDETAGSGTDVVYATATHTLGTGVDNLIITADGAINGTGNALANTMTGGAGNNALDGGDGADTLSGGLGNDVLTGGAGVDSLIGGGNDDLYVLDNTSDAIVEMADEGIDSVQIAATYALTDNVENLTLGGAGNFAGTGSTVANIITGNTGDNELSGLDGADTLIGGAGSDILDGGLGADNLTGGAGDDVYIVDNAGDVINEISGQGAFDEVHASVSQVLGLHTENLLLTGSNDIDGTGNAGNNEINGNSGANALSGLNGADTLEGFDGDDRLDGGAGTDTMMGGIGNDTYVIDVAGDLALEGADSGTDTVETALAYTLLANFENLKLTGTAAVNGTGNTAANDLTGNAKSNKLMGLEGDDTLNGGAGADTLDGGTGNDSMTGGAGSDRFVIDSESDVAVEDADGGIDTIQTVFTAILGANFENLVLTGSSALDGTGNAAANQLTGNAGANTLSGLAGADTISGNAGADTLDGGAGSDSMLGGMGNDDYIVDATADKIVEAAGGGTDEVFASATYTLADNVENVTLTGTDDIDATGNTAANTMLGNSGANALNGGAAGDILESGAGADELNGGTGEDTMSGGTGDDVYYVDRIADVVVEENGEGTDTVFARSSATLSANVESLVLQGTGTFNGTGNTLDNLIFGNNSKNLLKGLGGDDVLEGNGGADVLTGGAGADVFLFAAATVGNDTITDFNAVDGGADEGDQLVFDGLEVGTFVYRGGAAFTGGSNNTEARFDAASGLLQIDVDGDGALDFALKLTGMDAANDLTSSDFFWF